MTFLDAVRRQIDEYLKQGHERVATIRLRSGHTIKGKVLGIEGGALWFAEVDQNLTTKGVGAQGPRWAFQEDGLVALNEIASFVFSRETITQGR